MNLSKLEIKLLNSTKASQDKPITFLKLLRASLGRYLILIMCASFGIIALINNPNSHDHVIFLIGMIIGVFLRDFGYFRIAIKLWSLNREIIDWNKVDELIKKNASL